MVDTQSLREIAQSRTPFSAWLGVVLLFSVFGLIVFAIVGPSPRGSTYEQKRAEARLKKLQDLRQEDAKALTTYGWIDKGKGVVRVPIERAMELTVADLAQKRPKPAGPIATPAAPAAAPAAATGVATPTASPAPAGSPVPSATPKPATVEGPGSKAQSPVGTNPPGTAPTTQPGPSASPAASQPPAAHPPVSPLPGVIPSPPGTPLPVGGKSPEGG
jgi:hypothetical protein